MFKKSKDKKDRDRYLSGHMLWRGMCTVLIAGALGLASLVPQTARAVTPPPQVSADQLCVLGSVISHDEKPLGEGWGITATPYDEAGALDAAKAITATTDGAGQFGFAQLEPGNWQLSIDLKSVEGEWEGVTATEFDISMAYGQQTCQTVRFKLRRIVVVEVLKVDDFYNALKGWILIAMPAPRNYFASKQMVTTDDDGIAAFRLTPGEWIFSEQAPNGVRYTPVIPLKPLLVNVQPPGPITLFFKNRILETGCIDVAKYDMPDTDNKQTYPLPGWGIEVRRADGSVAAKGRTDALGKITFCGLPLGPYTVVEEMRLGWRPKTPSQVLVNLVGGSEAELVEFYNIQNPPGYIIVGYKIDDNGHVGLPGWTITAKPLKATDFVPSEAVTDGTGRYEIVFPDNDYRVPGAKYTVCEESQPGWLPHTKTCQVVQLPTKPGAPVLARPFINQQVGHSESGHAAPTCQAHHTVKRGQTWLRLARMHKISIRALRRMNPKVYARSSLNRYIGHSLCVA